MAIRNKTVTPVEERTQVNVPSVSAENIQTPAFSSDFINVQPVGDFSKQVDVIPTPTQNNAIGSWTNYQQSSVPYVDYASLERQQQLERQNEQRRRDLESSIQSNYRHNTKTPVASFKSLVKSLKSVDEKKSPEDSNLKPGRVSNEDVSQRVNDMPESKTPVINDSNANELNAVRRDSRIRRRGFESKKLPKNPIRRRRIKKFQEEVDRLEFERKQKTQPKDKAKGVDVLFEDTKNARRGEKAKPLITTMSKEDYEAELERRNKRLADEGRELLYPQLSDIGRRIVDSDVQTLPDGSRFDPVTGEIIEDDVDQNEKKRPIDIHDMLGDERDFIFNYGFSLDESDTKKKSPEQIDALLDRLAVSTAEQQTKQENPSRVAGPFDQFPTLAEQNENPDIEIDIDSLDSHDLNLKKRQQECLDYMFNAFTKLNVEGMQWTKDENTHTWVRQIPKYIQPFIAAVRSMYRCSISDVFSLVVARTGLGIDSNGKLPGHSDDFTMSAQTFADACMQIMRSQKDYGHPLHIVGGKPIIIGGTRCYPMGYLPRSLVTAISQDENSVFNKANMRESDIQELIRKDWISNTLPNLINNTQGDGNPRAQRMALFNMMRGIMAADGRDPSKWNVPDVVYISFASMQQDKIDAQKNNDEDRISVINQREEEFNRLTNRILMNNKAKKATFDKNGNMVQLRRSKLNDVCNAIASWERFAGVFMNFPLMFSGHLEKVQGNIDAKVANQFLNFGFDRSDFKLSKALTYASTSKEAAQATGLMQRLYTLAGADAVKAFSLGLDNGRYEVTSESVAKFIDDWIRPQQQENPGKFTTVAHKIDVWYRDLMEGRALGFMAGADAKRMMEMALVNNRIRYRLGDKSAFNTMDVERLVNEQGIARTMFQLASTDEGFDAFISMSNMNLARKSPISYAIERALSNLGPINVVLTTFFETYITYGVNFMQLYMPFSNSVSYLITTGFTKIGGNQNIYQYQLGGYHAKKGLSGREWLVGLKENAMYDLVKMGNTLGYTLFWASFIAIMGGLDDPPEEGDKYNWLEWRIGIKGEVGELFGHEFEEFKDEGGHIYIPAWWMNDLTCYGLPLAVAWHVDQKYHNHMLSWKVFLSGCGDMVEGSSVLDVITLLTHPEEYIEVLDKTFGDEDYMQPKDATDFQTMIVAGAVDDFTRKMTPAVVRDYFFPRNVKDTLIVGQEARNHTAAYVYDTVNYSPEEARELNKKVSVDSFEEQYLRAKAKYNPVLAVILNISRNDYILDNGHSDKTGYLFEEMPISTKKDEVRAAWGDHFHSDLDNPLINRPENADILEQVRQDSYLQILEEIDKYGGYGVDPSAAIANGFWIPPEERLNAIAMTYDSILYLEEEYTLKVEAGMSWEESREALFQKKLYQSVYYDLLNNWLLNDEMPWSDEGYQLLMSDWEVKYYYRGTNEPATMVDWLANSTEVEKKYVPMGNSKTSFLPFTQVNEKGRGYNFETISNWYEEGLTDTQRVYDENAGRLVPYGQNEGRLVNNTAFAGKDDFTPVDYETELNITPGVTTEATTIDRRSYVPVNDKMDMYLTDDQIKRYGWSSIFGLRSNGTYGNSNGNELLSSAADVINGVDTSDSGSGYTPPTTDEIIDKAVADGVISESEAADLKLPGTSGEGKGVPIGAITIDLHAQSHNKPTLEDLRARQQAVWDGDTDNANTTNTRKPGGYYGGGYGVRRSYGGGGGSGGSSNYNPRIYNNVHAVYANKAQGLQTHQPYKATTTYLRPEFVTKGSREAYKRSDI